MAASSIAAFFALSFLLVLVPGADWAFTITSGLRDRSVVPAVGGLMLGYVGLTAVVVAGVAALVARTPGVLTSLTALGAGYLVWLGATTFAGAKEAGLPQADDESSATAAAARSRVLKGAGVSGLNPKALLLYVALLPQFADQHGQWPLALQIGLLGLLHMCTAGAVYLGLGSLARTVLRARPTAARLVTRLSGVAMILLGALLLVEQLPH
ncbi:LysE family translocator [Streptomyces qinglanensis]|uniref:Threonine/homoserine/homoserine lactone efflux protein n=1 Tax=Streptomyces qinglanensis TaxID=943816 RepID=A0A1H9PP50_9ACTN|nr:LysE family translocator [Streptomyces qinglanensis]SER49850.1 Threonine/homoserine/homoserine lactone efflux protein [Streptomyces qinglanensis]